MSEVVISLLKRELTHTYKILNETMDEKTRLSLELVWKETEMSELRNAITELEKAIEDMENKNGSKV
jgi:polyhydroxyalkanoate synthesis regulator phasin